MEQFIIHKKTRYTIINIKYTYVQKPFIDREYICIPINPVPEELIQEYYQKK